MDAPTIATWIVLIAAVLVATRRIVRSFGQSSDLLACLFVPPNRALPWPRGVQESDEPWGWAPGDPIDSDDPNPDRGELFIGAGVEVYEGMIIGENSRSGDMNVNATKTKQLTNIRTHSHDESLRLTPPRPLTLESAIEFIAGDELVEVTPKSIRLRKRLLSEHDRRRERGKADDLRRATEREPAAT